MYSTPALDANEVRLRTLSNFDMDDDKLTAKLQSVVYCPVCNMFWHQSVHASRNILSLALFSVLEFVPSVLTHNLAVADFSSDPLTPASDNNPLLTTCEL
ncbi:hypothetical protein BC941DRAFT_466325 [Chlamydoabsidia padenii]|nr:hypothetical protein BC941DRAFT_466325 [Chlamydoabsidia padenii]